MHADICTRIDVSCCTMSKDVPGFIGLQIILDSLTK
jgi:hypothetical protein